MAKRLRFTGENPPTKLWVKYPNWQYALEEEDLPDQDETTIRPADNQRSIDDDVCFSAGDAISAGGATFPALLYLISRELDSIYVIPDPKKNDCWILQFEDDSKRWVVCNDEDSPSTDGILAAPLDEPGMFPLRVTSRLPVKGTRKRLLVEIERPR